MSDEKRKARVSDAPESDAAPEVEVPTLALCDEVLAPCSSWGHHMKLDDVMKCNWCGNNIVGANFRVTGKKGNVLKCSTCNVRAVQMSQSDEWKEMQAQVKDYDKEARESFWNEAGLQSGVKNIKLFLQRKMDKSYFRKKESGAKKRYYPKSYLKKQGFPVKRIVRVAEAAWDFKDTPTMGRCYPCEILDEDQRHGTMLTASASMTVGDRGEDDAGQDSGKRGRAEGGLAEEEAGGKRARAKAKAKAPPAKSEKEIEKEAKQLLRDEKKKRAQNQTLGRKCLAKLACVKYSVDSLVKTKEFKNCPEFVAVAMKEKKKTIDDMQAAAKGAVDKGDGIEFTYEDLVVATQAATKAIGLCEAMIAATREMGT